MKIAGILFLLAAGSSLPATSGFTSIAPISGTASRVVGVKSSPVGNINHVRSSQQIVPSLATRTSSSTTRMATDDDDSVTKRIGFGHSLSSFLFVATALGICYNGIGGPVGLGLPLYAASGPYLAAGVSSTLESAASAGRLGSDTYKRLALFLTEFNLCGLTTILLAIGGTTLRQQLFYVLSLASLLSLSPTLAGYKNGGGKLFGDIGGVIKEFFTCKNLNGFIYLGGTWFVAALKVLKIVDIVNLVIEGNPAKTLATRAVRLGRLALLTGTMLVLKSAADRDRLEGTTFIDLNILSSAVFGCMAFYIKTIRGALTPLVYASAGFSAFTALNAINSMIKKSKK
eukprot:CAMPEP_0197720078 /NCGR_PEP_ID=MMETSP1434-20131217/3552_1 /TAXON_ID=265543 /ORGANISM="Minutocellus polymorphus, Strain CCMP3303" /LENGTH=342 /DNA_ID=CAMNT_0043304877 /DNA_START=30 /DNA_END=1058 /DNA_ORIENTATION=-